MFWLVGWLVIDRITQISWIASIFTFYETQINKYLGFYSHNGSPLFWSVSIHGEQLSVFRESLGHLSTHHCAVGTARVSPWSKLAQMYPTPHCVWGQGMAVMEPPSLYVKWDRTTHHVFSLHVLIPFLMELVSSYSKDKLSGQTSKGACIPTGQL